jgi:outer membrane usher protein
LSPGTWRARSTSTALAVLASLFPSLASAQVGLGASSSVSATSNASAALLEPVLLDVTLNGQAADEPMLMMRSSPGGLYAEAAALKAWRLTIPATAERVHFDGREWIRIDGHEGLSLRLAEAEQRLSIEAAPSAFGHQWILSDDAATAMTRPSTGAYINYDVFSEYSRKNLSFAGLFDAAVFTPLGVAGSSFAGRIEGGKRRVTRLDTNFTIDRPDQMVSLRLGDGIARGSSTASPVRFAGLQFARNFESQPGFVTFPLPSLEGSAALPSVAEVYVDSVLRDSRPVDSGPFTFGRAPVRSGGGTVELVTRDLLGREVVSSHRYYTSSELLRVGLHDFSYELGFLRKEFGRRGFDYGSVIASAMHRYGLTDGVTLEATARLTPRVRTAGAAMTATVLDLVQLTSSAAVSNSRKGSGALGGLGIERRSTGLSFGFRTEYRSPSFTSIGEPDSRRTRLLSNAFVEADIPTGSIALNLYDRRDHSGKGERLIGLSSNIKALRRGNFQVFARRAVSGTRDTAIGAFFSIALNGKRSSSVSLERSNGRLSTRYSVQQDVPAGVGYGFRAMAETGSSKSFSLDYSRNSDMGAYSAEVARRGNRAGIRLSASGSAGILGNQAFASRRLGSSFAQVRVGREAGVRVYADERLVGRTGANGTLIVPELRAFETNPIRINDSDLPMTVLADRYEAVVRPYARTGNIIRFDVAAERGAIVQLVHDGGKPVPAGASVAVEGRAGRFIVTADGEVYVPGLTGIAQFVATWNGAQCAARADIPATMDPQAQVRGLNCRTDRYAKR